jgi:hypothetical protein
MLNKGKDKGKRIRDKGDGRNMQKDNQLAPLDKMNPMGCNQNFQKEGRMKKGFIPLIAILVVGLLVAGLSGKKANDENASLQHRIEQLEREIAALKSELSIGVGEGSEIKPGVIKEDDPVKKAGPRVFLNGTRGWQEDGTNMWTAMTYYVGINTLIAPTCELDVNGDVRITGGINDGGSFGLADQVLIADGLGGVMWAGSPAGAVDDYIWNQYTAAQSPASWWIDGKGKAVNAVDSDTAIVGIETATGRGVLGQSSPAAGSGVGVTGIGGYLGVVGWYEPNPSVAGALGMYDNIGVYGVSNVATGAGVFGVGTGTVGTYGETDASAAFGVYGYNGAAGGDGVFGFGNGALSGSYWGGAGVAGTSDDVGIFAHGSASDAHGLVAVGNGTGVWTITGGAGAAITSSVVGVYARGDDAANSWGLYARSSGSNGVGAYARSNANPSWALVGVSATAGWYTVTGEDGGLTANGLWCGGIGWGDDAGSGKGLVGIGDATNLPYGIVTASGSGVCGFSSDYTGVFGCSDYDVGVWGYTFGTSYACIQAGASSANTSGLFAVCNTGYRAAETVGGDNLATGEYSMGVFNTPIQNGDYNGLYVGANVVAYGYWYHAKSSKGQDISGAAMLSPDANVVISGTSELRNGSASIAFDEAFKEMVSQDIPINVIATPTNECYGIFVSGVSIEGFAVKELSSGKSAASFNWIAIGRRKGCEKRRVYAEQTLKTKIASKETIARAATTINPVTKKDIELKESEIKKVTPKEKKAIDMQEASHQGTQLKETRKAK